jgi:hypothetical protein
MDQLERRNVGVSSVSFKSKSGWQGEQEDKVSIQKKEFVVLAGLPCSGRRAGRKVKKKAGFLFGKKGGVAHGWFLPALSCPVLLVTSDPFCDN